MIMANGLRRMTIFAFQQQSMLRDHPLKACTHNVPILQLV
jgi:hypothetical protein